MGTCHHPLTIAGASPPRHRSIPAIASIANFFGTRDWCWATPSAAPAPAVDRGRSQQRAELRGVSLRDLWPAGDRPADQPSGDGTNVDRRPVGRGTLLVYTVGRTFLIDHYHNLLATDLVRLAKGPDGARAYAQLVNPRWSFAIAARSTAACRDSTMISPSRAACWPGPAGVRTCNTGKPTRSPTGCRGHHSARSLRGLDLNDGHAWRADNSGPVAASTTPGLIGKPGLDQRLIGNVSLVGGDFDAFQQGDR